ncbi:hypothetical protein CSUI_006200 [Cystoisospora suis]|uniref:Uncharacterized protein n=1 Tax=Cystoisospora suis TaxID=483139 RepID=A0A2C6KHJ4_9APIC|nr:hypothetical protein CSUI_006200 [Cystoisospora suis]
MLGPSRLLGGRDLPAAVGVAASSVLRDRCINFPETSLTLRHKTSLQVSGRRHASCRGDRDGMGLCAPFCALFSGPRTSAAPPQRSRAPETSAWLPPAPARSNCRLLERRVDWTGSALRRASSEPRPRTAGCVRRIASLLQSSLQKHAGQVLDSGLHEGMSAFSYRGVDEQARASAAALRTAADHFDIPLPGPDGDSLERISVSSPGGDPRSGEFFNDFPASYEHSAATAPVIGLISTPSSGILLSNLLAIWRCGAVALILPYPSAESCAVVADSVSAATASAANAAVVFGKNGQVLHTYTADALSRDNTGPSTYTRTCNPNSSFPSSTAVKSCDTELRAYARTWEYQVAESRCQLLVATPEVAATARVVASKLALPVCILVVPRQRHGAGVGQLALPRNHSDGRSGQENDEKRKSRVPHLPTSPSVYVPDVLHDSSRETQNVTRWRLLKPPAHFDNTAKRLSSRHLQEQRTVRNQPAIHFYQSPSAHAPQAAVYGHAALAAQAVRNAELLGLSADDHVAVMSLGSKGGPRLSLGDCCGGRMLCSPKGLVAIALPAVVAGAALSVISSLSEVLYHQPLPLPMHLRRLQDRVQRQSSRLEPRHFGLRPLSENPNDEELPGLEKQGHSVFTQSGDVQANSRSCRNPERGLGSAAETEVEALDLWEALTRLTKQLPGGGRTESSLEAALSVAPAGEQESQEISGVSVLALDFRTAALMVEAMGDERTHPVEGVDSLAKVSEAASKATAVSSSREGMIRGAVDQSAGPKSYRFEGQSHGSSTGDINTLSRSESSRGDLVRYAAAARGLRLVCICTDEGDLRSHCGGRGSRERGEKNPTISEVLKRWQSLLGTSGRVVHLSSLTETGLLLVDAAGGNTGGPQWDRDMHAGNAHRGGTALNALTEGSCAIILEEENDVFHGLAGAVAPGVEITFAEPTGQLVVRSRHMASCFYNRPRSSREAFGVDGEFRSSFLGRFATPHLLQQARKTDENPERVTRIEIHSCLYTAAVPRLPLMYELLRSVNAGPKMERHIEGYVKKKPIASRDWNNLHAPRKHWKKMFL